MITLTWARAMAAYNSEMNRRLYAAADTLEDAARRAEGGAFFGSIHGTLCHLLWGDTVWMNRFDGWERPPVGIPGSTSWIADWAALKAARVEADAGIEAWAARLTADGLEGEVDWFSGANNAQMRRPRWLLITHMFNHQTHHRGQAHALLTRAGAQTGATDLPWVIPAAAWAPAG
ncbi:DinB family protein [Sediminicoccus sp. KRV36]|uniref:DinB family protein n=1 Tax=Sediminicoccus sp. KRV36 TaxID=3133721 RepID=UPI00200C2459|nr:DinB family protein [Sediminicoccus rosea]UPY36141.1 DinB family protein [Sediminicoccus rosea]